MHLGGGSSVKILPYLYLWENRLGEFMCNLEQLFTEENRVLTIRLIPFLSVELLITSWGFKYRILETDLPTLW